ncbi:hypothetical protein [Blastococcus sp. CT_GayMR16]|uniref:hypothetical protein n=1 Tax=Blastococcus sp. CT_GayMR16 TaxID=2559607 RepID=UPI00107374DC|nr:hypothetical protein [Blastococcus sp. CT_GayMR16]TFV86437.1 hypothetical protein E4P38_16955 [Blastococcus sp. CT_GayMR16]
MLRRAVVLGLLGLLTGCTAVVDGSGSSAVATSAAGEPWSEEPIDTLVVGEAPEFPTALDHWALQDAWSTQLRAFEGDEWTTASGPDYESFPATMNGCDEQRFLVRWRVVVDAVDVEAAASDVLGDAWKQVSGNEGWMDLDGCYSPSFRLAADTVDGSSLVDVAVEVQQYWPAV